jgi:hypothetical protein
MPLYDFMYLWNNVKKLIELEAQEAQNNKSLMDKQQNSLSSAKSQYKSIKTPSMKRPKF